MSFMAASAIAIASACGTRRTEREHGRLRRDNHHFSVRLELAIETTGRRRRCHPVKATRESQMSDDRTTTISATFETREAADLAVEHLVQQHGISRPDIFIRAAGDRNTAGAAPSGGDASHEEGARHDAPLAGEIEVSVDIASSQATAVERSFADAGALRVSSR
jgi:hypothetical protein